MRGHLLMPVPPITRTGGGGNYSTSDWVENWTPGLLCPEAVVSLELKKGTITHCYGWNRETLGRPLTGTAAFNAGYFVKLTQIRKSAEKIQMIDGNWFYLDGSPLSTPADWRTRWDVWGEREPMGSAPPISVNYRHKQGANVLFYDGHVLWMPKQDIHGTDPIVNARLWGILD